MISSIYFSRNSPYNYGLKIEYILLFFNILINLYFNYYPYFNLDELPSRHFYP